MKEDEIIVVKKGASCGPSTVMDKDFDIEEAKRNLAERFDRMERGGSGKIKRKHGTNYTPPKKRHRK
jgi:hypothetical protein